MHLDLIAKQRAKIASARERGRYARTPSEPLKPARRLKGGVRCSRLNTGFVAAMKRGLQLVQVLASSKVPDDVYDERMHACHACPHSTITGGQHWCECCGCPHWSAFGEGSALERKNRHAAHECPAEPQRFGRWQGGVMR